MSLRFEGYRVVYLLPDNRFQYFEPLTLTEALDYVGWAKICHFRAFIQNANYTRPETVEEFLRKDGEYVSKAN